MPAGRPIRIHQVLATLAYGDAIGHQVLAIQNVLRRAGYASDIFVETYDHRLESATRDYRELIDESDPDDLLVHHFSLGSRASRVAFALPGRMVLIYHNITPPEYFVGVHRALVRQCFRGRRELSAYAKRCDLALGDSEFNRAELQVLGFPRTGVLPVVADLSYLDCVPDRLVAEQFDDEWTNILFVGRVIPNKRIEDIIRAFHAYHSIYNPRSRLLIVGAHGGFERYLAALQHLTADLETSDVHFMGHVSGEELAAYYEIADVFLCLSEHEGFCVPIVEAFFMGVPVVAYASTAVPSTMDGAGVLIEDKDPRYVAEILNAVVPDRTLRDRIVDGQLEAVERLRTKKFDRMLVDFVEATLRSTRAARPNVAFDFWQQFDAAQELEELRLYRPGIYKALPAEDGGN